MKIGDVEITEPLRKILSLVLSGEKLIAYANYCNEFKKQPDEGLFELAKLTEAFIAEISKNAKLAAEFVPEKCCVNCIGCCGLRKEKMAKGIWTKEEGFVGNTCPTFMTSAILKAMDSRNFVFLPTDENRPVTGKWKRITVSTKGGMMNVLLEYRGRSEGVFKRKLRKIIVSKESFFNHIIKKMNSPHWRYKENTELLETLTTGGIEPIPGENIKTYVKRAISTVKKMRDEALKNTRTITKEEATEELLKLLGDTARGYFNDSCGGNIEEFLAAINPGKDVWGALESEKLKKLDAK